MISFEMSLCSAQAPGDADFRCTDGHERPPVYPDNVRMLMDSNLTMRLSYLAMALH